MARGPHRLGRPAEDRDQPVALDAGQHVEPVRPGGPADVVDHRLRLGVRRLADHDDGRVVAAPAQRGGPRSQRVVGLAAQQRVDDQRLQPGVPRAAGLGRLGVDLGGRERDLAGVAQHRLAQLLLVPRGDLLDLLLDDGDDDPDQLDGLLQGDRPGQLARRGAEDVGADRLRRLRVAEPLDERGDAGLGDQVDPRAVLGGHRAVPGQDLVHPGDRPRWPGCPCCPRGGAPWSVLGAACRQPRSGQAQPGVVAAPQHGGAASSLRWVSRRLPTGQTADRPQPLGPVAALRRVGFLLERRREPSYRVKAYRGAADVLAALPDGELDRRVRDGTLTELKGVGAKTAAVASAGRPGQGARTTSTSSRRRPTGR